MRVFITALQWLLFGVIGTLFVLLCSAAGIFFIAHPYLRTDINALPHADAAIVFGAGVYQSGAMSPVLAERVQTAAKLYEAGIVGTILVSGDNGSREYNEVIPAREYLTERGIPPEDIFLDYAGFDTYDSLYRARAIYQVKTAILVTQSFHLPRAIFIARILGIDAWGADTLLLQGTMENIVREYGANAKAILDLMGNAKPRYLGEPIPITGDGRGSWGE